MAKFQAGFTEIQLKPREKNFIYISVPVFVSAM